MPEAGPEGTGVGIASEYRGALDDYVAYLAESLEGRRIDGMHVVVDCGNGAAFRAAPSALRLLGAEVEVLHAAPERLEHQRRVRFHAPGGAARCRHRLRAQIGLAFDGDADRVIAVDEQGELIDGDQMLADRRDRPP